MDFTFNDEQLSFQDSVRAFLTNQVTPERQRELWATESGRSDELWAQLADLGLTALNVPEDFGGLGLDETDWVLLAQECGYAALAEIHLDRTDRIATVRLDLVGVAPVRVGGAGRDASNAQAVRGGAAFRAPAHHKVGGAGHGVEIVCIEVGHGLRP